jgi:hypothetical protein
MALATTPSITASLTLSSPNMINDAISLTVASKLNKAGVSDGLDQIYGISRKHYATAATADNIIAEADYDDAGAHKVYIRNCSTTVGDYLNIELGGTNVSMGRLYSGEWAFFPWDGTNDIDIDTSGALTIEFAVIYQSV